MGGWDGDPTSGRNGQIQEQEEAVPRLRRGWVPAADKDGTLALVSCCGRQTHA